MKSTFLEKISQPNLREPVFFDKPDGLRKWILKNMAPIVFLSAFFLTIVVGNLLFVTEYGRERLAMIPHYAVIYEFSTIFTPLYWVLLLLPFFVTPLIVILVQRSLEPLIHRWCSKIPEIRPLDYTVFTVLALGYVGYSLWRAHAFSLYGTGMDAVSSVEIRFQILAGLRFWTMAILMSILPYLAVYALIRCFRCSNPFWITATILVASIVSVYMILLNMKWPFLVFEAAIVLTIFSYSKTYPYIKALIGAIALFAAYLIISTHVFRLTEPVVTAVESTAPVVEPAAPVVEPAAPVAAPIVNAVELAVNAAESTVIAALRHTPDILFSGVTRMAILYPFYFQIITKEGAVCGGILEQARVGPKCRPSTYIYTRVFGRDGFEGRGTSPTAVHISGYSLGGWPLALFAMVCTSIILGLITCLPNSASAMVGALGIMGAIAGYHFSQLPGEGPLFYDHGLVWTLIPMAIYITWRKLFTSS